MDHNLRHDPEPAATRKLAPNPPVLRQRQRSVAADLRHRAVFGEQRAVYGIGSRTQPPAEHPGQQRHGYGLGQAAVHENTMHAAARAKRRVCVQELELSLEPVRHGDIVGIEPGDVATFGGFESVVGRDVRAARLAAADQPDASIGGCDSLDEGDGVVLRRIVDDHVLPVVQGLRAYALDRFGKKARTVAHGGENRHFGRHARLTAYVLSTLGRLLTASFRRRPVFVVGAGRSGTSIVQDALGAHPQIVASDGESPFICAIGAAAASLAVGHTLEYRLKTLRTSLPYTHESLGRIAIESAMGAGYGLRRVIHELIKRGKVPFRVRRWCTKTFPGREVADGLAQIYPDVKFVYIFRNGAEVVRSRTHFHAMRDQSFEHHCREWADSVDRYSYLLADERAMVVRHEVLTSEPDAVLRDVQAFLGVSQSSAPATLARTTLVHPLDERTQANVPVRERLVARTPAHEQWTSRERATFKKLCANAMEQLGYEIGF